VGRQKGLDRGHSRALSRTGAKIYKVFVHFDKDKEFVYFDYDKGKLVKSKGTLVKDTTSRYTDAQLAKKTGLPRNTVWHYQRSQNNNTTFFDPDANAWGYREIRASDEPLSETKTKEGARLFRSRDSPLMKDFKPLVPGSYGRQLDNPPPIAIARKKKRVKGGGEQEYVGYATHSTDDELHN